MQDNFSQPIICTESDISDLGAELSRKVRKFQKTEEKNHTFDFSESHKVFFKVFYPNS